MQRYRIKDPNDRAGRSMICIEVCRSKIVG